jgi:hypothetical protein
MIPWRVAWDMNRVCHEQRQCVNRAYVHELYALLGRKVRPGDKTQVTRCKLDVDDRSSLGGESGQEVNTVKVAMSGGQRRIAWRAYDSRLESSLGDGGWPFAPLVMTPFSRGFVGMPPALLTSQQRTVQSEPPLTKSEDSALKARE